MKDNKTSIKTAEVIDKLNQLHGKLSQCPIPMDKYQPMSDILLEVKLELSKPLPIEGGENTIPSLKKWVDLKSSEAWNKMGDTGSDDYKVNEENYWFGYYRALEDIEDKLPLEGGETVTIKAGEISAEDKERLMQAFERMNKQPLTVVSSKTGGETVTDEDIHNKANSEYDTDKKGWHVRKKFFFTEGAKWMRYRLSTREAELLKEIEELKAKDAYTQSKVEEIKNMMAIDTDYPLTTHIENIVKERDVLQSQLSEKDKEIGKLADENVFLFRDKKELESQLSNMAEALEDIKNAALTYGGMTYFLYDKLCAVLSTYNKDKEGK